MPADQNQKSIWAVFGALFLALWLAAIDQTVVSTALPTMVAELGGLSYLSWVVTAYLLTSTVAGPLYGKFGDLYGRKIVLQDLDTEQYDLYSHQNEDIVRLTPEQLRQRMAEKERLAAAAGE